LQAAHVLKGPGHAKADEAIRTLAHLRRKIHDGSQLLRRAQERIAQLKANVEIEMRRRHRLGEADLAVHRRFQIGRFELHVL